jgi:CDP-diglyceride synthetase
VSELARRVLFSVVAAPLALLLVYFGDAWLATLLAVAGALGAWELFRIARAGGVEPLAMLGIALAAALDAGGPRVVVVRTDAAAEAELAARLRAAAAQALG